MNKPRTDKELLLQVLCLSEHDFDLQRSQIELEPFKFFWHAVCLQARASTSLDLCNWIASQCTRFGVLR